MKVRISYTTEVSDRYRRAINHFYGRPGLATREEVKDWLIEHGSAADGDITSDLDQAEEKGREEEQQ